MQELLGKYKLHSNKKVDKVNYLHSICRQVSSLDLEPTYLCSVSRLTQSFCNNKHDFDLMDERIAKLIASLQQKLITLNSNGKRPRTTVAECECDNMVINPDDQGQSSDSVMCSCNSGPPPEDDCSDTSLKLA
ncbi:hypothetical protein L1987_87956 [Smallanthus sonchifolius]|nr:hypothetical protein L1987_87956 [Smallanthus sonchifolius]